MTKFKKLPGKWLVAPIAMALMGSIPNLARADSITYILSNPNPAIQGFTGPYGSVTITTTGANTATVTLTSNTVGSNIYLFGGAGTLGLNVNASKFTASNIVGTNPNNTFQNWKLTGTGSGNEDGFGSFNFQVNSFDGFAHAINSLTLTLTNNSGTWASASNVLTPNTPGGSTVGAHVFVTSNPPNGANGALVTGYAGNGTNSGIVPEPSSVALGLIGLVGLGLTQFRRIIRRKPLALA
jgi:hypothetical protein